MLDARYKPPHLPQVNMNILEMVDLLKNENVDVLYKSYNCEDLQPSQGIVFGGKINDIKNVEPIWISIDNFVIDGHHRYVKCLIDKKPIDCIQVQLPQLDASRILNKLQDIHDNKKLSEVVAQDAINANNERDPESFIAMLEEESAENFDVNDKSLVNNKSRKIIGYRSEPLTDKSKIGNFFMLDGVNGMKKYEIEFNSLLDTDDLGLTFGFGMDVMKKLTDLWFPNIDFDKVAKKYDVNVSSLRNRAVAEKAKTMGYDGIKYGDIMVQGF